MAADPFSAYIRAMKAQASKTGLIVLGNQGADLDSIASALVLAWHLAGQVPGKTPVAVIAIPRHQLRLRPEAVFVLGRAAIEPADLLFTDDDNHKDLLQRGAELVLVDHNALDTSLYSSTQRVTAIIDHHHDQGQFPEASPRIIDEVGSTATLIGELVFREQGKLGPCAALLLLSAILMDTANFSAKAGRSTDRDKKMAEKLLSISGLERETFFNSLQQAQYDLAGLNSAELLARDYKEWPSPVGDYGMSTVLLSLSSWQQREPELFSAISQFANRKKLTVLIVMMASHDPDFHRELILFCKDKELLARLATNLDSQGLRLSPLQQAEAVAGGSGFVSVYGQGNTSMSRKKLQPLLHSYLGGTHIDL